MTVPAASVVIVTRNRAPRLRALLDSLAEQTHDDFETVVVDDRSTDETAAVIARAEESGTPNVQAVHIAEQTGLAALRNAGWRRAEGRLVCFIDDDCIATSTWLEELVGASFQHPGAVVQGRTVPIPGELERTGPLTRTKLIERAGPWYQTCNIAYPKDLLEELDGFDDAFTIAGEDTDLAWRAIESGAPAVYAPSAIVQHAVEDIGIAGWLAIARRERPLNMLFSRHPDLRTEVVQLGFFKGRAHATPVLALLGLLGARGTPLSLVLAVPYALLLLARLRADRAAPPWIAWYIAYDAVAISYSLRGALESGSRLV